MEVQQDQPECPLTADPHSQSAPAADLPELDLPELMDGETDADGTLSPRALRANFTPEERERLRRLRRAVGRGERSDAYPVDRRQDFIRWLIDQGKLSDN